MVLSETYAPVGAACRSFWLSEGDYGWASASAMTAGRANVLDETHPRTFVSDAMDGPA